MCCQCFDANHGKHPWPGGPVRGFVARDRARWRAQLGRIWPQKASSGPGEPTLPEIKAVIERLRPFLPEGPYLLRGISIERPNQVWSTIPYIPMRAGFLYLVAVMDWFSRFVLGQNCHALETALLCSAGFWDMLLCHEAVFNSLAES